MTPTKIKRTYARTVELKKPDGTSVWIKHEAEIEAAVDETNLQHMAQNLAALNEVCVSEVSTAIKNEKELFLKSVGPGGAVMSDKASFDSLPKHV